MATRGCINSPNTFCYIFGEFVIRKHQRNITDFIEKVYFAYFGIQLGVQDKCWAPHKVCYVCLEDLRKWSKGMKRSFRFGIPMVWREQTNHSDNCYFCWTDISGYYSKNKKKLYTQIFHLSSARFLMVQAFLYFNLQSPYTML